MQNSPLKGYLPENVIIAHLDDVPLGIPLHNRSLVESPDDVWSSYLLLGSGATNERSASLNIWNEHRGWCVAEFSFRGMSDIETATPFTADPCDSSCASPAVSSLHRYSLCSRASPRRRRRRCQPRSGCSSSPLLLCLSATQPSDSRLCCVLSIRPGMHPTGT